MKTRLKGVAVLALLLLSVAYGLPLAARASDATSRISGPVSVALSVVPPKLPADGNRYNAVVISLLNSSGMPVVAPVGMTIYLSSELPSVANVDPDIAFPAGMSYVVANLTTSGTPGSTQLTASAAGLKTGTVLVQTVVPSGFPDHLVAFAVPPVQLARSSSQGEVVVQVQDDLGIPARTVSAVTVSLSSSDNRTVRMDLPSVVIPSQQSMAVVNYTAGLVTGSASITASAGGFSSGFAGVEVVSAPPLVLRLTAQPNVISVGSTGRVVVSLTDASGAPAEAPKDLQVFLTSSDVNSVVITGTDLTNLEPVPVVISKGQIFTATTFTSPAASPKGGVNITASAHGLAAGFANVQVYGGLAADTLGLSLAPNPVPSTGQQYPSVAVSLQRVAGAGSICSPAPYCPSEASKLTHVVVTASDNSTGKVLEKVTVDIAAGSSYAVAPFNSTLLPSTAVITAAAQNLTSAQARMNTERPVLPIGPAPSRVVIAPIAPVLPADGVQYQGLLVSFADSLGGPAIAPEAVTIHLSMNTSNFIQIIAKNQSVTIPGNESYVIVPVQTLSGYGTTNVTAESSGYKSSWAILSTRALSPAQIALYASPTPAMLSSAGEDTLMAVQLQGSDGTPARARAQTVVTITSSNTSLLAAPLTVTIPVYSDYELVRLTSAVPSTSELTAISPGLRPADMTVVSLRLPVMVSLAASSPTIYLNGTATLIYSVSLMNRPLQNASVTWLASSGTVSEEQSFTGPTGVATVKFTPSHAGIVSVTAAIDSQVVGRLNSTTQIVVYGPTVKVPPSLVSELYGYLPYIGVGVAAALVLLFVFWRRRRGTVKETEDETFSIGDSGGGMAYRTSEACPTSLS